MRIPDDPTTRLLLCCARHRLDAETLASVEELLQQGIDWGSLLNRAEQHNLVPLLHHRLQRIASAYLPPDVKDHLQKAYYLALLRGALLLENLQQIVGALRGQGVETIVLKGGALAGSVYRNPALRSMCDLDLLIRREDIDPARLALGRLGYSPPKAIPSALTDFWWKYGGGMEFAPWPSSDHRIGLDVHWHLLTIEWYRCACAIDVATLWNAARPLDLDGTSAWQLSAEDTLINLCLHPAIQHGFTFTLIPLVDIDWFVGSHELQWERVIERAQAFRVKTPTYWGLSLAQQILGTAVPSDVLPSLQPPRYRLALTRRLLPRPILTSWGNTRVLRNRLLRFSLIDRPSDMLRTVWRAFFPQQEWLAARYALKDRASVHLYRLLHPLKVMGALSRAALRNTEPLDIFYARKPHIQ